MKFVLYNFDLQKVQFQNLSTLYFTLFIPFVKVTHLKFKNFSHYN